MKEILKNTAISALTERARPLTREYARDRWKAIPFLILMFTSGLPLNYELAESRPMTVADVADLTSGATAISNSGSSTLFVILLAALYSLSGLMLLRKPKIVVGIVRRQWPLACLMILVASSVLWSLRPEKAMLSAVHITGVFLIAMAAAIHYRHDPWSLPRHLGYLLGFNMVLQVAAALLIPSYSIDWQGRWQGLTSHPNTLGALAFTTLWANCVVLICRRHGNPYPHIAFAILAAIAMLEANSVTSIVTAICSIAAIFISISSRDCTLEGNSTLACLWLPALWLPSHWLLEVNSIWVACWNCSVATATLPGEPLSGQTLFPPFRGALS